MITENFTSISYFSLCYGSLYFACSLYSLYLMWKSQRPNLEQVIGFFSFAFFGYLLRFYLHDLFSIWLDEDTQLQESLLQGALYGAPNHQQMPFSYALSILSNHFGGFTEYSIRFFPILWGGLACGVFYLILNTTLKNRKITWLGALLFSLSPWLVRYSLEARPYSLNILATCLYTFAFFHFSTKDLKSNKEMALKLFPFAFFLINSTFLQNFVFIFSISLAAIITRPSNKSFLKQSILSLLLALILSLPNIYFLYQFSKKNYQKKFSLGFQSLHSFFSDTLISLAYTLKQSIESYQAYFWYSLLPLTFFYFYHKLRDTNHFRTLRFNFIATSFCLSIFTTIFFLFINWYMAPRYTLSFSILFMLNAFIFLDFIFTLEKKSPFTKTLGVLSIVFFLYSTYTVSKDLYTPKENLALSTDWRSAFSVINERYHPGDLLLTIHPTLSSWRIEYPVGYKTYLDDAAQKSMIYSSFHTKSTETLRHALESHNQPKYSFLLLPWAPEFKKTTPPLGTNFFFYNRLTLLRSDVRSSLHETVLMQLNYLKAATEDVNSKYVLLEYELEVYLFLKNLEKAQGTLAQLNSGVYRSVLDSRYLAFEKRVMNLKN